MFESSELDTDMSSVARIASRSGAAESSSSSLSQDSHCTPTLVRVGLPHFLGSKVAK